MDDRLIVYFDLLGFSNLMKRRDPAAEEAVLRLLTSLATLQQDFSREETEGAHNTTNVSIQPAISTFSDHIVYSYPLEEVRRTIPLMILRSLAWAAATIAYDAMRLGCLVRGAITLGPLHHANRVLFGRAMIDAHELESHIAVYPRIVIAENVAGLLGATGRHSYPLLFKDDDGMWCLDYMGEAFDIVRQKNTSGNLQPIREWIAGVRQVCDEQIAACARDANVAGLRYWRWFRARFDRTIASRHPSLTGEPRSADQ